MERSGWTGGILKGGEWGGEATEGKDLMSTPCLGEEVPGGDGRQSLSGGRRSSESGNGDV